MAIGLHSPQAEELMIGTCAHESKGGTYLKQVGGPAIGIWQMEQPTHDDIWRRYLPSQPIKSSLMANHCQIRTQPSADIMMYHLTYACAMARLAYARHEEPIPKTIEEQALYWKHFYNTSKGGGTVEEYINDYQNFIGKKKGKK